MSKFEHHIPWLPKSHTCIDTFEDISNFHMFQEYKQEIDSGKQHVSKSIELLFVYLFEVVFHLDIYLDVTASENA